ncbi:MAG: hypothetical protein Q9P44_18130 [Anaerolineae bacterium]|nr:hypothetical protein [Anaerolineae bacterium]
MLVRLYQSHTAQVNHPFDVILTADGSPNLLASTTIMMPINPF